MSYSLIVTDTFLNQLLGLPQNLSKQITKKLKVLQERPDSADGDAKKLKGQDNLYRVRINDYRLIYTFRTNWVKCLTIGHRSEIYKNNNIPIPEDELIPEDKTTTESIPKPSYTWGILTKETLTTCFIPEEYHQKLLDIKTEEELLYLDIPEKMVQRILDILYPPSLATIEKQPEKFVEKAEDLEEYFQGNITAFLLKLDEEQERICNYKIGHAVLMKGGPGTGKTVLAIYRVKNFLESGCEKILFTAHSSALINYAQKLLRQLLGEDIKRVEIKTVDSEITSYYLSKYNSLPIPTQEQYLAYLDQALQNTKNNHNFTGNKKFYWYASFEKIKDIGLDYLLREIIEVIEACGLVSQQEYLEFNSVTRITGNDKEFIWAVYQQFKQLLATNGFTTPEQYRIKALELAKQDQSIKKYDALVVDETQDLSPVSLNFILTTVKNKKNVFITADSSQSIYKRGFNWRQVHKLLGGHILDLNYNYRNTAEIVAAYRTILYAEDNYQPSLRTGEIPNVYFCRDEAEEDEKIKTFFTNSAKTYRMPLTGAALICPNIAIANQYVDRLNQIQIPARYVDGSEIDISSPYIKVITMEASKGLEFAFVAVVGLKRDIFPYTNTELTTEELKISLAQQKRLFYVACSRAIQNLAVYTSQDIPSKLAEDLREPYWIREGAFNI